MCKSEEEVEKVDLKNDKFEDLTITINANNKENIRFDENRWRPAIGDRKDNKSNGEDENEENEDNEEEEDFEKENQEEIIKLNDDIEKKKTKLEDLEQKIEEIKNKIDTMNKILNIDVSEKEYLKDLSQKAKS